MAASPIFGTARSQSVIEGGALADNGTDGTVSAAMMKTLKSCAGPPIHEDYGEDDDDEVCVEGPAPSDKEDDAADGAVMAGDTSLQQSLDHETRQRSTTDQDVQEPSFTMPDY